MTKETIITSTEDLSQYLNGVNFARDYALARWTDEEQARLSSIIDNLKTELDIVEENGDEISRTVDLELRSGSIGMGEIIQDIFCGKCDHCLGEKLDQLEEQLADFRKAAGSLAASSVDIIGTNRQYSGASGAGRPYAGVDADDCGSPTSCLAVKIADLDNTGPVGSSSGKGKADLLGVTHDALHTPTGHLAEETVKVSAANQATGHKKDGKPAYLIETCDPFENAGREDRRK